MAYHVNFCVLFLATTVTLVQTVPRIVDLSYKQNRDSITWPLNPSYNFTQLYRGYFETYKLWVTVEDLLMWEEKYGEMPRRAVAIMNSGWSSKYPNKTLVFGSPEPTDTSTFHFPSWHEDAVTWLINKRQINAVGVDTPSTDYGMSSTLPCHTLLGKNRVVGIENVANLDNVPESGSTIYIPVLNIADGSGGPARVFATYDDEPNKPNAAARVTCFTFYLYTLAAVLVCYVL